jgi:serine/threonine-protein kinase
MPNGNDTVFGRTVVEMNLATEEEVRQCLDLQQHLLTEDGRKKTLEQILVENGFVTKTQVERIRATVEEAARTARQIPGLKILAKIGSGAMAVVYKARQESLDRIVAVKVLPPGLSNNREFVERFYREGKAAAKLNHPNIVQAIDVGEASGFHYFVMEFVDGHTIYDELRAEKVFSEREALEIIIQIAQALAHAHERGFIHRDVKPKNIMLTHDRVAKLADMGLARQAEDVSSAIGEAGRAYGTPYYISPEQIRGEVDIDFRADIYSLGATFYHMVTGRVPFQGPTPSAVMHKHLREPLVPADHINTRLTAGVGEIIEVMMKKRKQDRYASTTDLLTDLEAVAEGRPPMQARKRIDAGLLADLAKSEDSAEASEPAADERRLPLSRIAIFVLGGLLAVSVIINLILALTR